MTIKGILSKYFLAFISILVFSQCAANEIIVGKYEAVSESEWALSLELKENKTAIIEVSNWEPGQYERRDTVIYNGTWRSDQNTVYVTYNGIIEVLEYYKSLSLAELGESGGLPGLKGQAKPWDKGVIGSVSLWLSEALKKRFRVQPGTYLNTLNNAPVRRACCIRYVFKKINYVPCICPVFVPEFTEAA